MPEYLAPGVYVEESDAELKPIPGVPTSTLDIDKARRLVAAMRPVIEPGPEWSRFNDADPGVTLIELFAWVAEGLLYRSGSDFERRRNAVLRATSEVKAAAGACAMESETMKRPRYSAGRLLDAATLQAEQDYHREKLRRHNRNLHGFGIVCGLEVHVEAAADSSGGRIVVEPGYAIDCCGEEIAVPFRVQIALPHDGEAAFVSLRHWEHPCPQSPAQEHTFDAGCTEEACLLATVADVLPPALAIAGLVRSNDRWTVDPAFVPPRRNKRT